MLHYSSGQVRREKQGEFSRHRALDAAKKNDLSGEIVGGLYLSNIQSLFNYRTTEIPLFFPSSRTEKTIPDTSVSEEHGRRSVTLINSAQSPLFLTIRGEIKIRERRVCCREEDTGVSMQTKLLHQHGRFAYFTRHVARQKYRVHGDMGGGKRKDHYIIDECAAQLCCAQRIEQGPSVNSHLSSRFRLANCSAVVSLLLSFSKLLKKNNSRNIVVSFFRDLQPNPFDLLFIRNRIVQCVSGWMGWGLLINIKEMESIPLIGRHPSTTPLSLFPKYPLLFQTLTFFFSKNPPYLPIDPQASKHVQ